MVDSTHSFSSTAKLDACGVCGGNNSTCTGCDGVPNSRKVLDDCGVCGGSGGCLAPLKVWSNNRMCINSTRMELNWQLAVNSTSFRMTVVSLQPSAMVLCTFSSFPLASPNGTCVINSYVDEDPVVSGPCSCDTKKTFGMFGMGKYKVDAYLNSAEKVIFDVEVGPEADACGVCGGDNSTCAGCDGVPNSRKV